MADILPQPDTIVSVAEPRCSGDPGHGAGRVVVGRLHGLTEIANERRELQDGVLVDV
ncbi:hypothetical protein [Actinoplanes sp. NPDC051411]|uniref:hypothetical protein n=1 Tax=Actinoplanes sp. NPDC051411 TaxID=3155522 RepID=UPI0034191562